MCHKSAYQETSDLLRFNAFKTHEAFIHNVSRFNQLNGKREKETDSSNNT